MSDLDARCQNVNRRIEASGRMVWTQSRNDYIGLDEAYIETGAIIRTITVGTKREVAEFLHAMMVGIDLSRAQS